MESVIIERKTCPACRNTNFKELYNEKFGGAAISNYLNTYYASNKIDWSFLYPFDFIICRCTFCDLIFQKNIFSDSYMGRFYDEWLTVPEEVKLVYPLSYYRNIRKEMEGIISQLRSEKKYTFLDYGMGWGDWSLMAQAYGHSVYGVELSVEKKKFAERHGITVIDEKDIRNHKFDFINTEQVFEHIPNPLDTLIYLKDSLNKNGILKIDVPNGHHMEKNIKKANWLGPRFVADSLMPISPLEHINCFNKKTIRSLANICDMKIANVVPSGSIMERSANDIIKPIYNFLRMKPKMTKSYYLSL